jgi:alanine-glyoxylate transaminase / serine-glyoxylate transaminase / serine-pyruvate transaminase
MVVRAGREFLAIPGPTTLPDEVLRAMHRPAVDIYSGPLLALTDSLLGDLRRLFSTAGRCYIYIANGHGAWEAALTNVLSRGDKVLVLESGRFALSWGEAAARLGVEMEIMPAIGAAR